MQTIQRKGFEKTSQKEVPQVKKNTEYCRVSGETGTYCEQPRHSEYGLNWFVVVQASSSTGLKAFLRPVAGKQTFLRLAVGKTIVLRPAAGKQSFYEY